ncbi:MAG: response regulator transcription factor [Actinomycetes bacterium]
MTLRALIVDDHPVYRAGLSRTLTEAGIEVVGEAADGAEAVTAAAALKPEVILMDVRMPVLNGIEATRHILTAAQDGPAPAVLVLTMSDDDESVFLAMRAGARGYLVKGASQERIVSAVQSVAAGDLVFGADVASRVLLHFSGERRARAIGPFPTLTAREAEVLVLIAAGKNNPQIARELFLSEKTVRNHVSNIFTKLAVTDRAHAIVAAREAGIGEAP